MTTSTLTIAGFLLARIAEDEVVARAASPGPWRQDDTAWGVDGAESRVCSTGRRQDAAHIARHDPARVLAECEAKRRIVEAFEEERVRRDIYNRGYDDGLLTTDDDLRNRLAYNAHCRGLEIALLALVLPYADHPDYREEWRP